MGKAEKTGNPIAAFKPRRFVCSKWPFLRIGGGWQFNAGHMTVESLDQMERLAKTDAFQHGQIIEILEKKKHSPEPTVEESAELAALEELEKLKPKVHRGAVSTVSMVG